MWVFNKILACFYHALHRVPRGKESWGHWMDRWNHLPPQPNKPRGGGGCSRWESASCHVPLVMDRRLMAWAVFRYTGQYYGDLVLSTNNVTGWKNRKKLGIRSYEKVERASPSLERGKSKLRFHQQTPRSRAPLENLTVAKPVKKFLTFYRSRRFIVMITRARHWTALWPVESSPQNATHFSFKVILILSSHLWLGLLSDLFHLGFFRYKFVCIYHLFNSCYTPRLSYLCLFIIISIPNYYLSRSQ